MQRKNRFVTTLGKSSAELERQAYLDRHKLLLPALQDLLSSPGVRKSSKGIIFDGKKGPQYGPIHMAEIGAAITSHPSMVHRLNAERIAIIKQLSALGHKPIIMKYRLVHSDQHINKVRKHGRVINAEPPVDGNYEGTSMIGLRKRTPVLNVASLWPRDMWTRFGAKRTKHFGKNFENEAGEGGKIMPVSENAFIVNKILKENETIKRLQQQGVKFYFVNSGEFLSQSLSKAYGKKIFTMHDHVDLFVGVTGRVMLVDYDFYRQNRNVLKQAARDNGLKIVYVPQEEAELQPANFLPLEPGKILMEKRAKKTMQFMREAGLEVIPTAVDLRANRFSGGGVRCFINEL